MSQTRIVISGPNGRMGQALCRLVKQASDLELAGGLIRESEAAGRGSEADAKLITAHTLSEILRSQDDASGFVLIDFTTPEATLDRLRECAAFKVPAVIGTTGFSEKQLAEIQGLADAVPILLSANMSVGVNVLLGIVKDLAARLNGYDIEVIETHHRLKKDSPSGTALALASSAAEGRGVRLKDVARHGREGLVGERSDAEIGIHAVRGGDVVGDHTVLYAGTGERIEITHKASSRDAFAAGALTAARWISGRGAGMYTMVDVLRLNS